MNIIHAAFPRLSRSLPRRCRPAITIDQPGYSRGSVQALRAFAKRFSRFEWTYLCSYRWFVNALESAVYQGRFISLRLRAEQKLINEGLRPRPTIPSSNNEQATPTSGWIN